MIIQPGPVVDFLIANQNVKDPFQIDWAKVLIFRCTVVTIVIIHLLLIFSVSLNILSLCLLVLY